MRKLFTFRQIRVAALSLLLGLFALPAPAADEDEALALVLTLKNGETVAWFLEKQPEVSFTADELQMTVDGTTIAHPLEDVDKYTFSVLSVTGINSAEADKQGAVSLTQNEVRLAGMQPGTTVSVHAADGRTLQTATIAADGSATVSLAGLTAGTYIINYGVSTAKILKK